ncbi:hypothetical protein B0I35DRAFT_434311 [Stachybotrys elegans]|uniref:Uncharacterized protein n=1 Tax=Stachybotrys elegans TaxID=80388 RepID=A0A8K0WPZ2_9HYPO|nr:hypothetical protein B0I35DRAFT_434311 [Stachybotrys elegans]
MIFETIYKGRQTISSRLRHLTYSGISTASGSCSRQSCQQYERDAQHWHAEHDKVVRQRKSLCDNFEKQLRERRNEMNEALLQNEFLVKKLAEKDDELRKIYMQLAAAKEKETKMRAIVLENTSINRVSDGEIRDKFLSIRQKAQAICNSSTYDVQLGNATIWGELTAKDRRNRMMSRIFELLQHYMLSRKVYCEYELAYENPDPRHDIEENLGYIETLFERNGVNETSVTNWRIATIACISELTSSSPSHKMVAPEIFTYFAPFISPKSGPKEQGDLEEQFRSICSEAWEVAMIMRRSREGHKCIVPPTWTSRCFVNAYEALAEPITVEGGRNEDGSDEIAYPLFGALVKSAHHHGVSKERVLEKAQVVLKKRSGGR